MTNMLNLSKETPMLDLNKVAPSLKSLRGVLNWDVNPVHKNSMTQGFDLDVFAFVTAKGKIDGGGDVAFFNNKNLFNGGVVVPRDNRTGEGNDDEEIIITLDKIPSGKDSIELFVFLFEADKRQQNFSMIQNGLFTLFDAGNGSVVQTYNLQQFASGTALHIGSVKRIGNGWGFNPVGDAAQATPNDVVSAFM